MMIHTLGVELYSSTLEDMNQVVEILRLALHGVFIASRCTDEPVEKAGSL
jgi:hypothetical protein